MKDKYLRFLVRLILMSLGLGLAGWLLGLFLPEKTINPVYPYMLLLFFSITAIIHYVVLRISRLNPRRFVSYFMLATFFKLIIYFTAVLVYVYTTRENVLSFILTFFIIYIFYTVFEVILILAQTKDAPV